MNQRELFLRHVAQTSDMPMMGIDINITRAEGCTLYDASGKQYLDLISGISVSSIGHCHPEVVKAIEAQSRKFMHLMVYGEFNQSPQAKYARSLALLLPPSLQSVFFTTGGAEAVEGALKLAKKATGRHEIVCFDRAYHGSTHGALSVMGDESLRNPFRPLLPGIKQLRYNDSSRLTEITPETAAVIIEPVQGEAGVRGADHDYLRTLRNRCDETGTLLIFDEIQTGFGRTGTLFAFHQSGIAPDILLIAKGMGGGLPIGAFVASASLMQHLATDPALGHINTFGGNAVCVAAAQACLDVLTGGKLWEKAKMIETVLKQKLRHPLIKELRCYGALCAVEFGGEPLNMRVIKECIERGLITDWFLFCPTALRIAPPLVISQGELEQAITIVLSVLNGIKN